MSRPTLTEPGTGHGVPPGPVRAFSVLNGLVLLGVLLQGFSAGDLMSHLGAVWAEIHQVAAYVVLAIALAAAVLAAVTLRHHRRVLAAWSGVLFLLVLLQTALGQAITDGDQRVLLAAHVPLALLIMALGAYLSIAAAKLRRCT